MVIGDHGSLLPNGPRISCGDCSAYELSNVSFKPEAPAGYLRWLGRRQSVPLLQAPAHQAQSHPNSQAANHGSRCAKPVDPRPLHTLNGE
jgi:hypothetical protein